MGPTSAVHDARATYLRRLEAELVGPRRVRRSLLREAADHLDDATDALRRGGWSHEDAAARAVADFGAVEEVAPSYQTVLAVASSRRTAWLLLAALCYQPFLWDKGLNLAARAHQNAPDTWFYRLLDEAMEICGGLVLLGAIVALLVTGVGQRWLAIGRRAARVTGVFAIASAVLVPTICLAMTVLGGGGTTGFWSLVLVLLIAPLAAVGLAARRTLATI